MPAISAERQLVFSGIAASKTRERDLQWLVEPLDTGEPEESLHGILVPQIPSR